MLWLVYLLENVATCSFIKLFTEILHRAMQKLKIFWNLVSADIDIFALNHLLVSKSLSNTILSYQIFAFTV